MSKSRLLVAVSSPWASEKFLAPIADIANRLEADVIVAHVAQAKNEDENESDAHDRGDHTLQVLADGLRQLGVQTDVVMLFSNNVSKALLNTAKANCCTMIVLGLTGGGMFKRLIARDVPAQLIRQSEIPVLLCPDNWNGMI